MKIARILEERRGAFRLEYDNARGNKQNTSLEATTYEQALREAMAYLEIGENSCDPEGVEWNID